VRRKHRKWQGLVAADVRGTNRKFGVDGKLCPSEARPQPAKRAATMDQWRLVQFARRIDRCQGPRYQELGLRQ
jgi:hypothetical protein